MDDIQHSECEISYSFLDHKQQPFCSYGEID